MFMLTQVDKFQHFQIYKRFKDGLCHLFLCHWTKTLYEPISLFKGFEKSSKLHTSYVPSIKTLHNLPVTVLSQVISERDCSYWSFYKGKCLSTSPWMEKGRHTRQEKLLLQYYQQLYTRQRPTCPNGRPPEPLRGVQGLSLKCGESRNREGSG